MENELKPIALESLGEDIFLKVPLYESKEKYIVKYVNAELFSQYFNDKDISYEHMAEVISNKFSTTIDKSKSNGKQIGFAYVDMQEDPLKISMSGNLGSGRAFYQDDVFNIKGEKTPLVRSKRPEYSNGVLEFEKSMFETISTNSLYNDTNIKLSPILAILDIKESCRVHWKEKICKRAKIVRMDMNGSLNRVTHIFKSKKSLNRREMLDMAAAFGEQEAEKFLQRIEHGAWSAGNISQYAHMIDFDTVSAVKYRSPQFSFCVWFADNYFGYEHIGQLKILKSLAKCPEINQENVSYIELRKKMLEARKEYLLSNFSKLMGFELPDKKFRSDIKKLFKLFDKLSRKCYPVPEDLSCKKLECYDCSPFDFSRFFRYYPILKRRGDYDEFKGYELLVNTFHEFDDFDIANFDREDKNNRFFYNHALKKLNKDFIHNFDELLMLAKECIEFIKMYDKFYDKLLKKNLVNPLQAELNAYSLNEDRTNLFMPHTLSGPIDDNRGKFTDYQIHRAISAAVLSNKRSKNYKLFELIPSDIKVFQEGFFAVLLNDKGLHKLSLNLYTDAFTADENDNFQIKINNKNFPCRFIKENDVISLQSEFQSNLNLIPKSYKKIEFYKNGKKITVNNFMFGFTLERKVSDFAYIYNL